MNTIERIKPGAKPINRLHALSGIKYQQLQTQKSRNKLDYFRRDVAILLCTSLILCLIAMIVLGLPIVLVLGKVEKHFASGNDSTVFNKGLTLDNPGNHTGTILFYNEALLVVAHHITSKGVALDNLGNYTSSTISALPRFGDGFQKEGPSTMGGGPITGAMFLFQGGAGHGIQYGGSGNPGGGPAISWPGEFGQDHQSMCPPDLDQTCGASITCLFHKLMCTLGIWK